MSCSSFQFYIKPQPCHRAITHVSGCSSFQFYIKPQPSPSRFVHSRVVPHSNSTSNHNVPKIMRKVDMLFLIPILHQTTTALNVMREQIELFLIPILHQTTTTKTFTVHSDRLFLIPILHQTTTVTSARAFVNALFLIPILHQTTTEQRLPMPKSGCSSFQFYIKPQPRAWQ